MYNLRELEATFIRYEKGLAEEGHRRQLPDGTWQDGGFEIYYMPIVQTLAEAQGIMFLCPLCFANNNGAIGTHSVHVSFEGKNVPPEQGSRNDKGEISRWNIIGGTGLDDLQLSPSIFLTTSHCKWHGFIGNSGILPGHAG